MKKYIVIIIIILLYQNVFSQNPTDQSLMTPFIKDYFERYEANKDSRNLTTLLIAVNDVCKHNVKAQIKCSSDDWEKLEILAKKGYPAAQLLFDGYNELYNTKKKNDPKEIQQYINKKMIENTSLSYHELMSMYEFIGDKNAYCKTFNKGVKKFGTLFMALDIQGYYLNKGNTINCLNEEPEQYLKKSNTDESLYLVAMIQSLKDLDNAQKISEPIFKKLYESSNDPVIKYNAAYCLGSIYYDKDPESGSKLIKESIQNGYIFIHNRIQNIDIFSDQKEIINIGVDTCSLYRDRI